MPITFQQQNITHAPYGAPTGSAAALTDTDRARALASLQWIEGQLRLRTGNPVAGYSITCTDDPLPDFGSTGILVAGSFVVPGGQALASIPVQVTSPTPIPALYTGLIQGTATYNANYRVRAYIVTDQPYLQNGNILIAPAGTWSYTAPGFAGTWMFELYDTVSLSVVGDPWLQTFPDGYYANLEVRLYSVTDQPYLQAATRATATPGGAFLLEKADVGAARIELYNTATSTVLAAFGGPARLVRSYALAPTDPGYGSPLEDRCYVYDQACALLAAISVYDDWLLNSAYYLGVDGDFSIYIESLIATLSQGLVAMQNPGGGFPFATPHADPQGAVAEPVYRTGAHAWAMYALAEYAKRFPVPAQYNGERDALVAALTWLGTKRNVASGVLERHTFSGGNNGYTGIGGTFQTFVIPWHSTEHNIDAWFALRSIVEMTQLLSTGGSVYEPNDPDWVNAPIYLSDMTTPLIENYWRSSANRAAQGLTGSNAQDTADALDTNSWYSMFLNAALSQFSYPPATQTAYLVRRNQALERMAIYGARALDGVEVGRGYSPYSPLGGYPGALPVIWGEGTFGVALALYRAGHFTGYNVTQGDIEFARNLDGSYNYAALRDDLYEVSTAKSVASTTWFVFATLGRGLIWFSPPLYLSSPSPAPPVEPIESRLLNRMHKVLRDSPAPVLNALIGAVATGIRRLLPSVTTNALYLQTARGADLDGWGDALVSPRLSGESDSAYRARLVGDLTANKSDAALLATAIAAIVGTTPTFRRGADLLASWGETSGWANTTRAFFDPTASDVFAATTNERFWPEGAYAPGGLIVDLGVAYNAAQETALLRLLERRISAGVQFDLVWSNQTVNSRDRYRNLTWTARDRADNEAGYTSVGSGQAYRARVPLTVATEIGAPQSDRSRSDGAYLPDRLAADGSWGRKD